MKRAGKTYRAKNINLMSINMINYAIGQFDIFNL